MRVLKVSTFETISSDQIKQVFQKEIECAEMLLQTLDQEYAALAQHHTAALEAVVHDKQEKIQQLELISMQREKMLEKFSGVNISKNDEHSHHYQFESNQQLTGLWNKLVDTAVTCREKNRINGSIVEVVARQSRHALDILHGILPDSSSNSELYNNAGQTTKSADKRSLVQV